MRVEGAISIRAHRRTSIYKYGAGNPVTVKRARISARRTTSPEPPWTPAPAPKSESVLGEAFMWGSAKNGKDEKVPSAKKEKRLLWRYV